MSLADENGSALPQERLEDDTDATKWILGHKRSLLRDDFAKAALTGILFSAGAMVLDDSGLKSEIAKTAYAVADEMLAAREGR